MLAEHDGDIAYRRHVCSDAADDIFFAVQVSLAACVELGIVGHVVVAIGEEFLGRGLGGAPAAVVSIDRPTMSSNSRLRVSHNLAFSRRIAADHAMHNGNVLVLDVVHHNLAHFGF